MTRSPVDCDLLYSDVVTLAAGGGSLQVPDEQLAGPLLVVPVAGGGVELALGRHLAAAGAVLLALAALHLEHLVHRQARLRALLVALNGALAFLPWLPAFQNIRST